MKITEIRVKLMNSRDEKLKAFCTITFNNEFVIRDIKIIEGTNGPFVAMPSRKVTDHCTRCSTKNHLKAKFCNGCGHKLDPSRLKQLRKGSIRLHTDIAHPINSGCRERIQNQIVEAFNEELDRSRTPGYSAPDIDEDLFTGGSDRLERDNDRPPRSKEKPKDDEGESPFSAGIY